MKRDEEITLWRSLCALGAPLYGNLCISFSPFLSALFLSFCYSLLFFLSVFLARPNSSLHSSSSFLSTSRSRDSFYHLPLFPRALSSASTSSSSSSLTHSFARSLARSVRHTRHGISPIPSFSLRFFPLRISPPRFTLFPPLSFSPSISFSRGLVFSLSPDSFAHLYLCPSFPF